MMPINTRGDVAPVPNQPPAPNHPPENPAPPAPIEPQMQNVNVPNDPRGTKRHREEGHPDSEQPVLKQARTEPVAQVVDPTQQGLINAIVGGDLYVVETVIKDVPSLLNKPLPNTYRPTPLCLAAQHGHLDVATLLLRSGALVNAPGGFGDTPLMIAAAKGHVNMMHFLCKSLADVHATNKRTGLDALTYAVKYKNLEACKFLICAGADMQRKLEFIDANRESISLLTSLRWALSGDFSELLAWWLDFKQLPADTIEASSDNNLLSCAALYGRNSINVVRMLMERRAQPGYTVISTGSRRYSDIWELAAHNHRCALIESLLNEGQKPSRGKSGVPIFATSIISPATDLCIHLTRLIDSKEPADCLAEDHCRQHPEKSIEGLARNSLYSAESEFYTASFNWCRRRWLAIFIEPMFSRRLFSIARMFGQSERFIRPLEKAGEPLPAQQLHMMIESLSDTICAPDFSTKFSDFHMTLQGAKKMNQIAVAQGELLLKGIARLRKRFDEQVVSLPSICVSTYISLSHQLNESDLYRKMTKEWGLYDPVARAALRLVTEAYTKLRELSPNSITAEFAALSLDEQLRHVIVDRLEEWDKVPEITETFRKFGKSEELEIAQDLLFQQWRLFCEAFGVTKPRFSQFGPHRPAQPEPVMEVDDAPRSVVATSSREVSLHPQ